MMELTFHEAGWQVQQSRGEALMNIGDVEA